MIIMAGLCSQYDPQFEWILAQGLLARRVAGPSAFRLLRIGSKEKK
jgi:hypothetical protein